MPTSASEMPVLPEVGSRMVWPGESRPSCSARSTMYFAMRSFTDPVGFWPSSLAWMRTDRFGERALISTSGVCPTSSSKLAYRTGARGPR